MATDQPPGDANGHSERAATAMQKPATGSQSGTLAELPALTNATIAAAPLASGQRSAASPAEAGAEAHKGLSKEQQVSVSHADAAEDIKPAEPAAIAGGACQTGDSGVATAQPERDAAVSPCASSAGKRHRPAGREKTARKAARPEGSASPGHKRQKQSEAAGEIDVDTAAEAGRQREQKQRILDLSHLKSFVCTAKGALDKLRGAGPRRRTDDVTLTARAVRALTHRGSTSRAPTC